MVLAAVQQDEAALQFASEKLQNDPTVLRRARETRLLQSRPAVRTLLRDFRLRWKAERAARIDLWMIANGCAPMSTNLRRRSARGVCTSTIS